MSDTEKKLRQFAADLASKQEPLGAEFARVLAQTPYAGTEDSMPSKRMVPEQEVAELSDEIVRLRAEIGSVDYRALAEHALAEHQPGVEHSREQWIAGAYLRAKAEIAALTKQRDRARAALQPFADAATDLDDKTKDVSAIWELPVAMAIIAGDLRRARDVRAALDAEAAAEKET